MPHLDTEGSEYPDQRSAVQAATDGLRATLSEDVLAGQLYKNARVDVADDEGNVLYTVNLIDAVRTMWSDDQ